MAVYLGIEDLRNLVRGTVIGRADGNYAHARDGAVWNELKPEWRPDVVVQAADEGDVVAAVRFARRQGLRVAVRSGGHHMCGTPLRERSVLIDLSRLNEIAVDTSSRSAQVGPGVHGRDLAGRLAAEGLAFPVGHCSTVALGGYLTSGGFGWNAGAWGPACFGVSAIDVVTGDGERRTASEQRDADLLWAARGAGPGLFGVITRFRLNLQPLPRSIAISTFVFRPEDAARAARWVSEASVELPAMVELILCLAGAPDVGDGREGWACTVVATTFAESGEEGERALAPLLRGVPRECTASTLHQPASFVSLFEGMNALFPGGHRYVVEAPWSDAEPAELVEQACRHIVRAPSAKSLVLCPILPPPSTEAPPLPDAAFSMTARSILLCYAVWGDPREDEANRAWHRALVEALAPRTVGYYVGESQAAVVPAQAERAFSPAAWHRLRELRRRYDPDAIFCGFSAS